MKLEMDETQLRESVERGEWTSSAGGKPEIHRYAQYAKPRRLFARTAG